MIRCVCGTDNRDKARFCSMCGAALPLAGRLPAGTLVHAARYRVVSILGQGGMGAVYLTEDQSLFGKRWALKEFVDTFTNPADRANAIKQFDQEARILVSLSHANLPHVADYFTEGGRQYLVMEYVDGDPLATLLQASKGGLSEAQVIGWAAQLCDVLEYLHGQKPQPVIFRDLKPANIMLAHNGQIKLIDFGIARLFDVAKRTDTLKMGTVGYAPPEQYAGHGQTDARSDIYALGAALHHLLTGRDPSTQPFIFPACRTLKSTVSPVMEAVLARAVQLDPAQRFQSAAELRQALLGTSMKGGAPAPSPAATSAAAAPTVPAAAPAILDVVGPEQVKWASMKTTQTFSAYCGADKQKTQWVIEGSGARSCLDCGRNVPLAGAGSHMEAWCKRCGRVTTHAWSGNKCACLGCGQTADLEQFEKQVKAWCVRCNHQTEWAVTSKRCACLGCSSTLSVIELKPLVGEYSSNTSSNRTWEYGGAVAGFCPKCGGKTPWLMWQVRYYTGSSFSSQAVRRCAWCGAER